MNAFNSKVKQIKIYFSKCMYYNLEFNYLKFEE